METRNIFLLLRNIFLKFKLQKVGMFLKPVYLRNTHTFRNKTSQLPKFLHL